ncbi:MAG TPA: cytochrome c [Terriglobales bacterium]|nr:cytochrome c [Terriglobales bacterium]
MKFILGIVVGIILVALAGYFYFATGSAPVATTDNTMPFEAMMANKALHARIDKEMPRSVPIAADEAAYMAGAGIYRENCEVCHGAPGLQQSAIAKGMFPKPPHLFRGKGVTDDPPGETYWKVANGIRLTGMPGFKGNLSDTQMWQVSLLLANADKISDAVKQQLAPPPMPAPMEPQSPAKTKK